MEKRESDRVNVLMINGSPHKNGSTHTALSEVAKPLREAGIEVEILHIGAQPIQDCTDCRSCRKTGRCVFDGDEVNRCAQLVREANGLVVGSPVYYGGPTGAVCSFMDRLFYSAAASFPMMPAASVVCCRRSGATAAIDRLNKYFALTHMPIVGARYWTLVHGHNPEELRQDLEGMQVMREMGRNMAWLMQNIRDGGAPFPQREERQRTNFIR